VEAAWLAAGHEGSISSALVSNLRSRQGLTGNLRTGSRTAESNGAPESVESTARTPKRKKRGRPAKGGAIVIVAEQPTGRMPLDEVERDIDRLIFKLIALGGMETIEEGLRKVRRLLYRSYSV
jgi:hypothetical protein